MLTSSQASRKSFVGFCFGELSLTKPASRNSQDAFPLPNLSSLSHLVYELTPVALEIFSMKVPSGSGPYISMNVFLYLLGTVL